MTTVNVQQRHADCRPTCQYTKEVGKPNAVCAKRCYYAAQAMTPTKQQAPAPEAVKAAPQVEVAKPVIVKPPVKTKTVAKRRGSK